MDRPNSGFSDREAERTHLPEKISRGQKTALLKWTGELPRFSSLREGGPGRPASLAVMTAIAVGLFLWGVRLVGRHDMDSAGPALVFVSCAWLLFLAIWALIKAGLRDRRVCFVLGEKGVEIVPSKRQEKVDRRIRWVALITFLFTWKGGQWASWHPLTAWKDVRSVELDEISGQIVVGGGASDIRLICPKPHFDQAKSIILERVPRRAKVITIQRGAGNGTPSG
jgi:hypothetical protein